MLAGVTSDENQYEAALLRSARRRRAVIIVIGAGAAAVLVWYIARSVWRQHSYEEQPQRSNEVVLTPAQQQELAAVIAQSRQQLAQLDAPWRAAIMAVDPRTLPERPACTALDWAQRSLAGNPQSDWGSWRVKFPLPFNGSSIASFSRSPFALSFIAAGEEIPKLSPAAMGKGADLDDLEHGYWSTSTLEHRKEIATVHELASSDVLVRIDRVVEPKLEAGNLFKPGTIEVSAWLFDHDKNKVICAGVVVASSSTTVDPGSSNLNDDLVINLVRALPSGMRAL